jgi:hypothetical protein
MLELERRDRLILAGCDPPEAEPEQEEARGIPAVLNGSWQTLGASSGASSRAIAQFVLGCKMMARFDHACSRRPFATVYASSLQCPRHQTP